ncbi:hypothetical protein [Spirillospora sp. NPDC047279]|uniref:hypothetical protein n=1 Tax=Spirillospora sp. NPDC047279 TaxID=3155478 RepID=UPI0033E56927
MTWKVKGDDERADWTFAPFESVGPLAFGMTPDEVVTALDGAKVNSARRSHTSEHGAFVPGWSRFLPLGVTTYFYGRPERLGLIAVDALDGVQVTISGWGYARNVRDGTPCAPAPSSPAGPCHGD